MTLAGFLNCPNRMAEMASPFLNPVQLANIYCDKSVRETNQLKSWEYSCTSRIFYLVQLISTVVTVPLTLIAGVFSSAVLCWRGEGTESFNNLLAAGLVLLVLGVAIPIASAIAVFAPMEANRRFRGSL